MTLETSYVVFGKKNGLADIQLSATTLSSSGQGFKVIGPASSSLGSSVSGVRDVNNDGINDMILGAPQVSTSVNGRVYVIFGRSDGFTDIDLSNIDLAVANQGFTISGVPDSASFGSAVSSAGDVNKDGLSDIVIGAFTSFGGAGASYVIYGRPKPRDTYLGTVSLT